MHCLNTIICILVICVKCIIMELNVINNNVAVKSKRRKVDKCERVHSVPCSTFHAVHGTASNGHQMGAVVTTAVVNGRTPFTVS